PPLPLITARYTGRRNARRALRHILSPPASGERAGVRGIRVALGAKFGGVVEDEIDLGERGVAVRRQCRGAARHDDAGLWVFAAGRGGGPARPVLPPRAGRGAGV